MTENRVTEWVGAHKVTHRFRGNLALNDVTVELTPTGITGLVGPNGAGKTTLMKTIAGLVEPNAGTVCVRSVPVRGSMVYYSTTPGWSWADQSIRSLMRHLSWLYPTFDRSAAWDYMARFGLGPYRRRGLSRGQASSLQVSLALATRAPVTLLDEPHAGMDSRSRGVLATILTEELCAHPRQIVIATHLVDEISPMLDRVVVLNKGSLVADSNPEELSRRYKRVEGATYELGLLPRASVIESRALGQRVSAIVDTQRLDADALSATDVSVSTCGLQDICEAIVTPAAYTTRNAANGEQR